MNNANIMRGYREHKDYTQAQASKALGVSQSFVSKVEHGTLDMTVEVLEIVYYEITGTPLVEHLLHVSAVGFYLLEDERAKTAANKAKRKKKKPYKTRYK